MLLAEQGEVNHSDDRARSESEDVTFGRLPRLDAGGTGRRP